MAPSTRTEQAEETWRVECGHVLTMQLVEDQLFARTTGDVRCIDRRDGRQMWVTELREQSKESALPILMLPSDTFILIGDTALDSTQPDFIRVLSFRGTHVCSVEVPGRLTAIQAMRRFVYAATSVGIVAYHIR